MPPMPPERATTIELWTEPLEAPPQPRAKEDNVPKLIDNGPQKTPPTAEPEDGEPRDVTTKTIWKNVLAISVAFMLSYTAFQSIQNLESSLISEQNLGTSSLSCVYGVFILSCNAAPFIIHNIGTKWTIVLGLIGNVIFTTVHFHPHHYTLIPTSIMLGILAGPLWSAQCTHLITCAVRYASMTNETIDVVISQFTGIFYMMYGMTQIFGNVISAAILDQQHPIESNETIYLERTCGAYDSGINDIDSTVLPSQHSQNILFAVYVVFGLVAVLVTIPMDTLDWIRGGKRWAEGEVVNMSIGCMCMSTIQMLRNLMYCYWCRF
ncbi:protein unc-93 homolog A-like [Saccoglossus kowalevskii]|uniref:Protein unc-93 homolog A-like n=1 Tax=Saccoglossus kowalevskii TaxID=10224 RepID=A0ABM0MS06_SACKO|nr:PREDICTED: protein unc-93 homolog A-like [Saccoglossus kowalevskii]